MPMAQRSPLPLRVGAAVVSVVFLVLLLPSPLTPVVAAVDERGWEARPIGNADIRARDRQLTSKLPPGARVGYHPETGRVRFISGTPGKPLSEPLSGVAAGNRRLSAADARGKARKFVDRYGSLFGLADPAAELRLRETARNLAPASGSTGAAGAGRPNATVRFDQVRRGVPVMGGEIVVQLTEDGAVLSAAGEVLPSAAGARTQATIGVKQALTAAARWVARELNRKPAAVATASEGLAIYDPRVMDDPTLAPAGTRLVWRVDATVPATRRQQADRRLVVVDARSGQVLTTIGRRYTALDRRVCDNKNQPGRSWTCSGPFARVEGQPWINQGDVDAAYRHMGVVYDYFKSRFGRDGIDDKGSRMKATVRYCPSYGCPWRNAEWRWGAQQATFGRGWAKADDIVAHEFTHGILDHEAPLFYHYQSGAINESYADVFGELVDLAYSGGKDTASSRWKIGEDTPIGWFRDMRNPPAKGHPDRVRSPRWHTSTRDFGGVHRNNGVGNKAAYLMAAGGSFRGYRIKGIGRERTARVWYQALTTRLTSAANYVDLADALVSACTDLAGTKNITFAHCKSVRQATRATQMNLRPRKLAPAGAPVCGPRKTPYYLLQDDLEDPAAGGWTYMRTTGTRKGWFWPQNPNDQAGWDGTWGYGKVNFYAPDYGRRMDSTMRMTSAVELPPKAFLRFAHGYSFDRDSKRRYDGGIVEIKVDDGPWRAVSGLFTHGKYNGTIAQGYGNPLAGKRAFTGDSRGWAKARLDLSRFAGSKVKVRFRMGSDRQVGGRGWYVDDIRIYTCAADTDKPSGSMRIDGGAATTTDRKVQVRLDYADPTTWVSKMRISGSPKMNGSGQLLRGLTMPARETFEWDLGDTTFGGSGAKGSRRIFAQVRDAAGIWSSVFSDGITWK
ncbi:MAG: M4 family metallopeptidase [Candidatus Limnocylindrales bacterium]